MLHLCAAIEAIRGHRILLTEVSDDFSAINHQRFSFMMEYNDVFLGTKYSYETIKNCIKRPTKSSINSLKIRMVPKFGERLGTDGLT